MTGSQSPAVAAAAEAARRPDHGIGRRLGRSQVCFGRSNVDTQIASSAKPPTTLEKKFGQRAQRRHRHDGGISDNAATSRGMGQRPPTRAWTTPTPERSRRSPPPARASAPRGQRAEPPPVWAVSRAMDAEDRATKEGAVGQVVGGGGYGL